MCPSFPHPDSSQSAVELTREDMECCICLQPFTRREKIPRMLHCNHTFCGPCLQVMSRLQSGLLTVCCPLCRWITCTRGSLPIAASLWVNTEIWDHIVERKAEEQEEEREKLEEGEEERKTALKQTQTSTQCECSSSGNCGLRLKLKSFLRRVRHW